MLQCSTAVGEHGLLLLTCSLGKKNQRKQALLQKFDVLL